MIYLYWYLVYAFIVAVCYVLLYHKYYMPKTVLYAPWGEKIRVYGTLFLSVFVFAPYCFIEILIIYKKGGFHK